MSHPRVGRSCRATGLPQSVSNDAGSSTRAANNQLTGGSERPIAAIPRRRARHRCHLAAGGGGGGGGSSLRLLATLLAVTWLLVQCNNHDNNNLVRASSLTSSRPKPSSTTAAGSRQTVGHNHHQEAPASGPSSADNNDQPPVPDNDQLLASGAPKWPSSTSNYETTTATPSTTSNPEPAAARPTSSRSHQRPNDEAESGANPEESNDPNDELAPESSSSGRQVFASSGPTTAASSSGAAPTNTDDYPAGADGADSPTTAPDGASDALEADDDTEPVELAGSDQDQAPAEQQDNSVRVPTTTQGSDHTAPPASDRDRDELQPPQQPPVQQRHPRPSRQSAAPGAQTAASTSVGPGQPTRGQTNGTPLLDLDMGSDRIMIKPAPADTEPASGTTTVDSAGHESATESSDSELLARPGPPVDQQPANNGVAGPALINERRQDLMYPSASVVSLGGGGGGGGDSPAGPMSRPHTEAHHQNQHRLDQESGQPSSEQQDSLTVTAGQQQLAIANTVCYTQFAILIIILTTVLITLALGFCLHFSLKHWSRHQFDLVANSKQFNGKPGYSMGAPEESGRRNLAFASSTVSISESPFEFAGPAERQASGRRRLEQQQQHLAGKATGCLLHLFQPDPGCNKCNSAPTAGRKLCNSAHHDELAVEPTSCAFRNPYFTGSDDEQHLARQHLKHHPQFRHESSAPTRSARGQPPSELSLGQLNLEQRQSTLATSHSGHMGANCRPDNETTPAGRPPVGLLQTAKPLLGDQLDHERNEPRSNLSAGTSCLYSIENHIANLHNRQVTSSVQQLAISGSQLGLAPAENGHPLADYYPTQIVDLTSDEQRAKILANPKEGDLVAVDITGHDIIGLGFDICGNQRDGILVKSVFAHGPAQESGCIQAGDRIKCLNINLDDVTLQDATDILNSGSPYKMRLLIEKRVGSHLVAGSKSASRPSLGADLRQLVYPKKTSQRHHQASAAGPQLRPSSLEGSALSGGGGGQFVDATRGYLRRLTSKLGLAQQQSEEAQSGSVLSFEANGIAKSRGKMAPGAGDTFQQHRFPDSYANNWRQQANTSGSRTRQHLDQYLNTGDHWPTIVPLGSAMARQAAQASRGIMVLETDHDDLEPPSQPLDQSSEPYPDQDDHYEAAYERDRVAGIGARTHYDDDDEDDEHTDHRAGGAGRASQGHPMKKSASSADVLLAEQLQHRQRHNRRLVQGSSGSDLDIADHKLRNQRHRLHGPQMRADGQRMIDLSQVDDDADSPAKIGRDGKTSSRDQMVGQRRHVSEAIKTASHDKSHSKSHDHIDSRQVIGQRQHLEISQSQPDIGSPGVSDVHEPEIDLTSDSHKLAGQKTQVSSSSDQPTDSKPARPSEAHSALSAKKHPETASANAGPVSAISKSDGHLDQDKC